MLKWSIILHGIILIPMMALFYAVGFGRMNFQPIFYVNWCSVAHRLTFQLVGFNGRNFVLVNGVPMTDTKIMPEIFGKRHDKIIQKLESLDCIEEFAALNFQVCSYEDINQRKRPMYKMTRDGWAILVMGFTGKKAMILEQQKFAKVFYIKECNAGKWFVVSGRVHIM